ncbi:hypothetical protein OESDEN_19155 [Oesophagostomum dentatum]|uniref:PABS domain-containing protein n=1 Tax=Oesophagostomum dentatum TaxID=61180 RepID=A0A0B1S8C6_OESDE|nr:hypothetical protein OESDEN_19155 [Oesophagostomum dentatum]
MKTIAEQYFHVQESEKQRIFIEDGLDFIKKAAEEDIKYDAILVDACINERGPILCPPPSFLKDQHISDFSKCLTEKGVLIVNIITPKENKDEADKILKKFEKHFKFCALIPSGTYDRMLFCFNYEHPWSQDADLIEQHILEADRQTGFHLRDGGNYVFENKE